MTTNPPQETGPFVTDILNLINQLEDVAERLQVKVIRQECEITTLKAQLEAAREAHRELIDRLIESGEKAKSGQVFYANAMHALRRARAASNQGEENNG